MEFILLYILRIICRAGKGFARLLPEIAAICSSPKSSAPWPDLTDALSHLRPGDTFVVWRLDRLARSLTNLIEMVNRLASRQITFRSITENIDTASATGQHLRGSSCLSDLAENGPRGEISDNGSRTKGHVILRMVQLTHENSAKSSKA
jgi:resolvase-like protein